MCFSHFTKLRCLYLYALPAGHIIFVFLQVIYIAPLKAIVRERMNDWRKRLVSQLGKKMVLVFLVSMHLQFKHNLSLLTWFFYQVEMTGDYTPDLMALLSADIIISTPEKWDGISRNWHSRSYVTKVHLSCLIFFLYMGTLILLPCYFFFCNIS